MVFVFVTFIKQFYERCVIYRKLNRLERMKIDGIRHKLKLEPIYTLWEWFCDVICFPFTSVFAFIYDFFQRFFTSISPGGRKVRLNGQMRRVFKTLTDENKLLRNVLSFTFGLFLTYLVFLFFYYQHFQNNYPLICLTIALTVLLALIAPFKDDLRCLILIALPSLFSSNVRYLLVAFIFYTLYFDVSQNIWNNGRSGVESFGCSVWQTGKGGKAMAAYMVQDIKNYITDTKRYSKEMIEKFNKFLKRFELNIKLPSMNLKAMCNEPNDDQIYKCEDQLTMVTIGDNRVYMPFACTKLWAGFAVSCQTTKDKLNAMYNSSREQFRKAIDKVEREFTFEVDFNHQFDYHYNTSKEFTDVLKRVAIEFFDRHWLIPYLTYLFNIRVFFMLIFTLWIFFVYRYLRSDPFDNTYINEELMKIEKKRLEKRKETLIPLDLEEKKLFINPFEPIMTQIELNRFMTGICLFSVTFIHILIYIVLDYCVYNLVIGYNKFIDVLSEFFAPAKLTINVSGDSFFAKRLNRMNEAFDVKKKIVERLQECKAFPLEPNEQTYKQILSFLLIIIVTIFSSAYGLRLRHYVAGHFYPHRVPVRAVWLYNNILSRRGNVFQFWRKQMRKHVFGEKPDEENISMLERLCAQWPIIRFVCTLLGLYGKYKYCKNCGSKVKVDGSDQSVHCAHKCGAIYCFECLDDLNNICSVCMNPIDYTNLGDVSEELDSSEEEVDYNLQSQDFWYQYLSENKSGEKTTDPDEIDLSAYQRKDLVALAYRYDTIDSVPKVVYLVDDEDYDAEDESEEPRDYEKYLFSLEQELGIPAEKILQMKQNAKELVAEDMDQFYTTKAKLEKHSHLKREEDQRLVRNALKMVNRDRRKFIKKSKSKFV